MLHSPSHLQLWLLVLLGLCLAPTVRADEPTNHEYFEREVRPILIDACFKCHGADKQESDLRLDSRERLLQGGVSGPAIIPGQPDQSLLITAIRHAGDLKMPPQAKLTEPQIAALTHWVKLGAPWPASTATANSKPSDTARTHWAFQPVRDPPTPVVPGNSSKNPIDAFIREKLATAGLTPSPPADRRTLARRLSYTLTGLPPTFEEITAFEQDTDPQAYENLVERMLARPQYGEHWGRHWLDVARYSDTKGYVYAREQRFWPHAWSYRDWVVQSLNNDLPYNRFLLLQIAADQAAPDDKASLAAMGFLTLGRRFLGVSRDIIDDRIDVVTRGTMGLTVACARCHDHKYDPIPTRDYYSLYGIFQSCVERLVPIETHADDTAAQQKYTAELADRTAKLTETMAARRLETADRNRARVGDYLAAQLELHKYPPEGFDQILAKSDLLPTFVHRWRAYLADSNRRQDPIFTAWHEYSSIPARDFAAKSKTTTQQLLSLPAAQFNPLVAHKFAASPKSMAEVAARYGELLRDINHQWQDELRSAANEQRPPADRLADAAAEALRQVLYGTAGPCEVPDEPIVNIEYFVDSATCDELWKLQNQVENWILQSPQAARHSLVLHDREFSTTPHVFKRGNPANLGDEVPRQFVSALAGPDRQPFQTGSGRLELAQAIIDPQNPLTARVIVNRVWAQHFGAGLVRTPSDFGTRAETPTHPELLDWLTTRFIADNWSLKQLHRRILTSETYQQSSQTPRSEFLAPRSADPQNRLLSHMSDRRLTFEEMRDSLLAATGQLDRTVGGKSGDLLSPKFTRRSLYGTIDRQFLPTTLRIFDFANPDLHIPLRSDTTVPQQALFFLNHPLMIGYAQSLAAKTANAGSAEDRIQQLSALVFQRRCTPQEVQAALELIQQPSNDEPGTNRSETAATWDYGYGTYDDSSQRITNFAKMPHFTGSEWQGSSTYPDTKLGWLQLTATGGHPGNDLAHAAIRRWTAPRDMQISVKSKLIHEPKEGAGVRGFLVSSRSGLLGQANVHRSQKELNVESLSVQAGDTLDFLVDIGQKLSYNQFLWQIIINPTADPTLTYDSERDFTGTTTQQLTPWDQLAQVLLATNEFLFID